MSPIACLPATVWRGKTEVKRQSTSEAVPPEKRSQYEFTHWLDEGFPAVKYTQVST
jgi:hypothetical protein